jgi:hypothetical protein
MPGPLTGRPLPDTTARSAPERHLLCRACREPVTLESMAIPIDGRSVHVRTNPAGVEFEFGCFEHAPGAEVVGPFTPRYSWFPGYEWSFALCRACGVHLGWRFEGEGLPFYGLILSRLAPGEGGSQRPS